MLVLRFVITGSLHAQKAGIVYPEDSVSAASKKAFEKTFGQGRILYNLTCARCHTMKEKNKDIIPDFSLPQLMDYEMRAYPIHLDKLDDKHITDEEMSKIILFLRFKKKSGREFVRVP